MALGSDRLRDKFGAKKLGVKFSGSGFEILHEDPKSEGSCLRVLRVEGLWTELRAGPRVEAGSPWTSAQFLRFPVNQKSLGLRVLESRDSHCGV